MYIMEKEDNMRINRYEKFVLFILFLVAMALGTVINFKNDCSKNAYDSVKHIAIRDYKP